MKKNIVQDVVPPRKSIRNIKMPSKKEVVKNVEDRNTGREASVDTYRDEDFTRPVPIQSPMRIESIKDVKKPETPEPLSYKYEYNETGKKSKKWFYLSTVLLVLAIAFGISALFKGATVRVSPKQEVRELNETFTAKKDVITGLGFQTVSVTKDVEKTVKATGEEKVEKKSQGRIIIYNNFSTQTQKLVATTRFQTPEGLIYRLISPVTIPGREVKDGKTVAGSIEVTVEADKPGISYNIGLKDFTIPGLKGDPKYTQIYARSKTEMTGGFSGMQKIVSKEIMAQVEIEMKSNLEASLQSDIGAQIPANFISYKDAVSYELEQITQSPAATNEEVVLKRRGKATAVIFDKSMLNKAILAKIMPDLEVEAVKISNISELQFKPANTIVATEKDLTFTVSGSANFVWVFDENKLKEDLLGLSKKSAKIVIGNYPAISEAWIETKPFWNQQIPVDGKKVTLINTANQN